MSENVNLRINRNSGIQCLMYFAFHIENRYAVDAVAQKMGVHVDTLYKWINGTHIFPAERITDLVLATGDLKYLEFIADKCGYAVIPKVKNRQTAEMMLQMARVFLSATGAEAGKDSAFLRGKK